jgi:hypothetical protein
MTVTELMEQLALMPPDAKVIRMAADGERESTINGYYGVEVECATCLNHDTVEIV